MPTRVCTPTSRKPGLTSRGVAGTSKMFPVRRIWCVGRNYIEHIREMGQDERAPPFFFAKPADALVPDGGVTWQLAQRLGPRVAFEVAMFGERMPADRCLQLGLVNRLVDDDQVLVTASGWGAELAKAAPVAVAGMKSNVRRAAVSDLRDTMKDEVDAQVRCLGTQDFREGVSAFLEKRTPRFSGR